MARATGRQSAMMACGLVLGALGLFSLPLAVREAATSLTRQDFVRDVFVVEDYTVLSEDPVVTGKLESTGERYSTTRDSIVGAERLQELYERKQLAGARADVWYLPKRGVWEQIDWSVGLRVQSPNEFGTGHAPWLVVVPVLICVASFLLIRQVVREVRTSPSSPRALPVKS
jgi:hypothetical protein